MRRREFITLVGGAAAWPLATRAQQPQRVRRIGVFTPGAADDPEHQARNAAFLQGLGELGWIVGRNVRIEYRWGAGDYERFRAMAAELVALKPNSVVTNPVALPPGRAKLATRLLPTGSVTLANTIGTVLDVFCNAVTVELPWAKITSGVSATNSAAIARKRS